jgi:hypothetical protein
MARVGIMKQVYGENTTIYAIADTMKHAEDIAKEAWRERVQTNCHYFVRTVTDNACIGDVI